MSLVSGAKAILEGFGDSPPPQEVAQARANVCLSGGTDKDGNPTKCPNNHTGGWSITTKASQIIHAQRQRKLELKLAVDGETSLGICKVCKCYLPLKVWYGIETIYEHTPDSTLADFPSFCWIKKGCQSLKTTTP
jgi:hypothetical protein